MESQRWEQNEHYVDVWRMRDDPPSSCEASDQPSTSVWTGDGESVAAQGHGKHFISQRRLKELIKEMYLSKHKAEKTSLQ